MRLIKAVIAIGMGLAVPLVSSPASAGARRIDSAVEAKIDAAATQDVASGRVAGAALAVLEDGSLVFAKGYGRANLELSAPVITKTVFRIGSLTKQFTAAAVLLLAEQGKLKVDDKLSLYLPNFPRANEVTLRDLLDHTSGIHNFTEGPIIDKISTSGATKQELIADIAGQLPLYDFDPGSGWWYSNSNYALLGAVIEKVSGKSWAAFLKAEIFDRLGMLDTVADDARDVVPGRAAGYTLIDGSPGKFRNARIHRYERSVCRRCAEVDGRGYGPLERRSVRRQAFEAGVAEGDVGPRAAPQWRRGSDGHRLAGRKSIFAAGRVRPRALRIRPGPPLGEWPADRRT